jgi:hypothetical protein
MEGGPHQAAGSPRKQIRKHSVEKDPNRPDPVKELAMNAIVATLFRDLTCAAAALVISIVVGTSFVQSTATAPGTPAAVTARQA